MEIEGSERKGPFLVICEHASRRAPEYLGNVGIDDTLDCHSANWMQSTVATLNEGASR